MASRPYIPIDLLYAHMNTAQRARWHRYMRRTMRLPTPTTRCGISRTLDAMERFALRNLKWKPRACR